MWDQGLFSGTCAAENIVITNRCRIFDTMPTNENLSISIFLYWFIELKEKFPHCIKYFEGMIQLNSINCIF